MPLIFAIPRLMRWNTNAITDHNRAPLAISTERIESKQRMADGTMRKFVVADKRTFSTSWEMLPKPTAKTVDGYWGGTAMESFYHSTNGAFTLELTDSDGTITTYNVMFTDFQRSVEKRGSVDFWSVSVTMEEV